MYIYFNHIVYIYLFIFLLVYIYKLYSMYIVSHIFAYNPEKFPKKIPKYIHQVAIFTYIK